MASVHRQVADGLRRETAAALMVFSSTPRTGHTPGAEAMASRCSGDRSPHSSAVATGAIARECSRSIGSQVAALAKHQSDDGSWRQVVDEPASYRELTVTAMTVAALARGISRGWIDRATYEPIINRGWQAVAARVNADGTVKDVCSGTGAEAKRRSTT